MATCFVRQKMFLLLLALLTATLGGCQALQLYKGNQVITVPHFPATMLKVHSHNGGIAVHHHEGRHVEILAQIKAVSPERLAETRVIAERDENNALCISVDWPEGRRRSREGCTFEILVPDIDGADLRSSNGRLSLSGCSGAAELKTSNGQIDISDHFGTVIAKTSNGRVEAKRVMGPVELESSNGVIQVEDVTDSVSAKTSNGSIKIRLQHESTGPVFCQTSNGSVDLTLGAMFVGDLTARTSNGKVQLENLQDVQVLSRGKKNAHLIVGEPVHKSTIRTSNGSIHIRRSLGLMLPEQDNLPAEAAH